MDFSDVPVLDYPGQFRLVRKIAEGGMATVYEAEQLGPSGFTKRTALKVIHPEYARRDEFLQLFIDEAKLSANLVHGNVVQIYQLGEVNGRYFIAMEYIQGPTLRAIIDRHGEIGSPIPPTLAAYAASRVCRALDFAHNFVDQRGRRLDIVHRDVSPGNVMATWDGHIKLADFGIAKARTSVDPADKRPMLMGKKHYMSPEQILGLAVDAPSDVFSAGVVLFEMLTLQPLFTEEMTELAIDEVAVNPIPSLSSEIPDLDPELEQILALALEKDPARRPTAAAMGHALDKWCLSQNELGTPDRLQEHLQSIFPASFQPRSFAGDTPTSFSALRSGPGVMMKTWWKKMRGAIASDNGEAT
ncbi:MAG TPA: serine/threonine-protein kinase [Gemmatimonadaceae bacterium]|jgi:serine/threonine-protein kinase|nr:serine/threonine-protein kinase [Gemmatimonadaceae bacterium]